MTTLLTAGGSDVLSTDSVSRNIYFIIGVIVVVVIVLKVLGVF